MNMKTEYRAELRQLSDEEKMIRRNLKGMQRQATKKRRALAADLKMLERNAAQEMRGGEKRLARITKRKSILKGRLNS
jgi:hypothetical protein